MNLCRFHHRAVHEDGFRIELQSNGRIQFYRPDGRLLPEVPPTPALAPDPVEAIRRSNEADGVEIGPWTPTPDWHGEKLELGWSVMVLRSPDREMGDVSAET